MPFIEALPINLADVVNGKDIECECMACHLPLDVKHGPVEWRLTWRFPGPYPEPGIDTMLMCDPCYRDNRTCSPSRKSVASRDRL